MGRKIKFEIPETYEDACSELLKLEKEVRGIDKQLSRRRRQARGSEKVVSDKTDRMKESAKDARKHRLRKMEFLSELVKAYEDLMRDDEQGRGVDVWSKVVTLFVVHKRKELGKLDKYVGVIEELNESGPQILKDAFGGVEGYPFGSSPSSFMETVEEWDARRRQTWLCQSMMKIAPPQNLSPNHKIKWYEYLGALNVWLGNRIGFLKRNCGLEKNYVLQLPKVIFVKRHSCRFCA